MTMQASEFLEAEDRSYVVYGFDGENQFSPESIGIKIDGASTACYRGWFANWRLWDGRLFVNELTIYSRRVPPICGIRPEIGDFSSKYRGLMLSSGFTGELTVIPAEDQSRARVLYYCIPDKDEIVSQFVLTFTLGRLKSVKNTSYLLQAEVDEDEPGKNARAGRIFDDVPTPFDHLIYQHFDEWEAG